MHRIGPVSGISVIIQHPSGVRDTDVHKTSAELRRCGRRAEHMHGRLASAMSMMVVRYLRCLGGILASYPFLKLAPVMLCVMPKAASMAGGVVLWAPLAPPNTHGRSSNSEVHSWIVSALHAGASTGNLLPEHASAVQVFCKELSGVKAPICPPPPI